MFFYFYFIRVYLINLAGNHSPRVILEDYLADIFVLVQRLMQSAIHTSYNKPNRSSILEEQRI